jgi:hypothetical protein
MVREAITKSASNRPAGGYDDEVGFGTVDAAAALSAAARLSARVLAGPGSPRTGLRRTVVLRPGVSADSHFGGGPAAVPAAPVAARGLRQLVLFSVLAAVCLAMIVVAASRLVLMRRPAHAAGYGVPAPPPAPAPAGPAYGTQQAYQGQPPGEGQPPYGPEPPDAGHGPSHHAAPPRFPWPATPPGRHTVSGEHQDGPGAGE